MVAQWPLMWNLLQGTWLEASDSRKLSTVSSRSRFCNPESVFEFFIWFFFWFVGWPNITRPRPAVGKQQWTGMNEWNSFSLRKQRTRCYLHVVNTAIKWTFQTHQRYGSILVTFKDKNEAFKYLSIADNLAGFHIIPFMTPMGLQYSRSRGRAVLWSDPVVPAIIPSRFSREMLARNLLGR